MIANPDLKLQAKPKVVPNLAKTKSLDLKSLERTISEKEVAIFRKRTEYYRLVE